MNLSEQVLHQLKTRDLREKKYAKLFAQHSRYLAERIKANKARKCERPSQETLGLQEELEVTQDALNEARIKLAEQNDQLTSHSESVFHLIEQTKNATLRADELQTALEQSEAKCAELQKKVEESAEIEQILRNELNAAQKQKAKSIAEMHSNSKELEAYRKKATNNAKLVNELSTEIQMLLDRVNSSNPPAIPKPAAIPDHPDHPAHLIKSKSFDLQREEIKDSELDSFVHLDRRKSFSIDSSKRHSVKKIDEASGINKVGKVFGKLWGSAFSAEEIVPEPEWAAPMLVGSDRVPKKLRKTWEADSSGVNWIACDFQGTAIATAGSSGILRVWDSWRTTELVKCRGPKRELKSVDFSSVGYLVLAACSDSSVWVWDRREGTLAHTLTGHRGAVSSAIFTVDGRHAVSAGSDRCIKAWDVEKGFCQTTISCGSKCADICLALRGTVASCHFDKSVRLLDMRSGKQIMRAVQHRGRVTSVTISPDQAYVLTNSRDNLLKLLDLRMNLEVNKTFKNEGYVNGSDWNKACFSGGGKFVIAGSRNGSVMLWDAKTAEFHTTLDLPKEEIDPLKNSVCCTMWNPHSSQVFTAFAGNGSVAVWE